MVLTVGVPGLSNSTPFAAALEASCDRHGQPCFVAVVAASFRLPRAGESPGGPLEPCPVQPKPAREDEYYGDPSRTSLRREGQLCYTRPGTDIYLRGHAWAPRGRACLESRLHLMVGDRGVEARVTGPRYWKRGPLGLRPSAPEPFERVPLRYEYCSGGPSEPRNPVGCGVHSRDREAIDQALPQIEDPRHLLCSHADRPPPVGLGPIGRSWAPRVGYSGTYDDAWRENRAPLWPLDFDERFLHAAHPALIAGSHLAGGESVSLMGGHPDGAWRFSLPTLRLTVATYYKSQTRDVRPLKLDAIDLDTDSQTMMLVLRATVPAPGGVFSHSSSIVRADAGGA